MKAFFSALFALMASKVAAQVELGDTSRAIALEEVIISANRVEEPRSAVSVQVEVISEQDVAEGNPATSADLVAHTGQVLVQKSQLGGGSPILRGFEASRVLLVVDGVRLNNILFRSGHLQNIITVDPAMLERAEIVFGPSSVVYGSDALGGVIHLYTRRPRLSLRGGSKVSGGYAVRYASAASEKSMHAHVNIGGNKLASLTSFTFSDFDDLVQGKKLNPIADSLWLRPYYIQYIGGKDSLIRNENIFRQVYSGYSQYNILQKFLFRSSDHVEQVLNFQLSNSSNIPRYDRLTDLSSTTVLRNAEWYYGPQFRMLAAYDLQIRSHGFFDQYRFGLNLQSVEESRHTRRVGSTSLNHRVENVMIYGLQGVVRRQTGKNDMRLGMEAHLNTLASTAEKEDIVSGQRSPLDTRYPDGDNKMTYVGIYATNTHRLSASWLWTSGLRLEHIALFSQFLNKDFYPFPFDEVRQSHWPVTGSTGLMWQSTNGWMAAVNVLSGFRAPNVDDLAKVFESIPGSVIVPNPDIEPERTYSAELRLGKTLRRQYVVHAEATGFYTLFRNAVGIAPFTFNGLDSIVYDGVLSQVLASQNIGRAFVTGANGRLVVQLPFSVELEAMATYTLGRVTADTSRSPLDHIPPVYGKVSASYSKSKYRAECYVMFNGMKKLKDYGGGEDNLQYATPEGMPAWHTVNLRVQYTVHHALVLQAGCDNLFDRNYRVFASGISGPGRNLMVAVRGHF